MLSDLKSNPSSLSGRLTAIESYIGGFAVANPPAPTVAPTGGSATSYSYVVVAVLGSLLGPSAAGFTSAGAASLNGTTAFNTLTWGPVLSPSPEVAVTYNVYRTVGGATQGKIASGLAVPTLVDTGLPADGSTAPSINNGGAIGVIIQETTANISASGAITQFGVGAITKSGVAALTLAAPVAGAFSAGGQDGAFLSLFDTTGAAHTVTTPSNAINGNRHIATFGGAIGNNLTFRAWNGVWYAVGLNSVTLS